MSASKIMFFAKPERIDSIYCRLFDAGIMALSGECIAGNIP
jgi:hypothetical protein